MPITQTSDNNDTTLVDSAGTVIGVAGSPIRTDPTGTTTQPISASSLPLPSGASTEATLSTLNGKVPSGLTVTSTRLLTDGSGVTQPISATALPLPTGAATSALQTTMSSSLTSIDGKLNSLGQKSASGSVPVVLASDQPSIGSVPKDGVMATYAASGSFTAASAATDIFTITGSASKTIRIRRIQLAISATTGVNTTGLLIKRSTANTAGTSSTLTNVPYDSLSAAGTATVRSYTANPTLGTTVGALQTSIIYVTGGGTTGPQPIMLDYEMSTASPITLRGVSEVLAINLNGATLSGNIVRATVVWTEE